MRVALGTDHAGYHLKQDLQAWLAEQGHQVVDCGACAFDEHDDYPDYAVAVGRAVLGKQAELGIMICGTGVGSSIALNKLVGIRAAACSDVFSARMSRLHNDANVLCLGERVVGGGLARDLAHAFLSAAFCGEARHQRRLDKIASEEAK